MGQKINSTLYRLKVYKNWEASYATSNSTEMAYHVIQDLQIKKFVRRFLNKCNLILHTLKLRKCNGQVEVLIQYCVNVTLLKDNDFHQKPVFSRKVDYHVPDLSLNLTESLLQHVSMNPTLKVVMQCISRLPSNIYNTPAHFLFFNSMLYSWRRHFKNPGFNYFVNSLLTVATKKDSARFLSRIIAGQLAETKRHNSLLNFWQKSFLSLVNSPFCEIKGLKLQVKGRINGRPRAKSIKVAIGGVPTLTLSSNIDCGKHTCFTQNGTIGVCVWIFV